MAEIETQNLVIVWWASLVPLGPDCLTHLGVFYSNLNSLILSQDTSQLSSASDKKCYSERFQEQYDILDAR